MAQAISYDRISGGHEIQASWHSGAHSLLSEGATGDTPLGILPHLLEPVLEARCREPWNSVTST